MMLEGVLLLVKSLALSSLALYVASTASASFTSGLAFKLSWKHTVDPSPCSLEQDLGQQHATHILHSIL